ncbi:OmpA family protein [Prevotella copri]|uniref:OmpA family protein n=3 Tax=Segatella TaxID=2974251 RepID=A0AAW5UA72_9BACT|nr:OmpA family protein [Segatella copri]MCW4100463.1 OmpA family protein [Segatella copri]MCW4131730.1 OmpA family protein [Segatella copri]MCW4162051.1 OmpA family protein [Segatella copri]
MKSYKYLLATAVLASLGMNSMAQATYTDKDGNEYQFKKHFYLDIQGGGQYTLGEAKFKDLLSPNIQGAIGYQFSPVFGLRAQMNGLWSKGGWAGFRSKVGEKPYNAKYKFKYIAPGVDFMFNLSNLFCGWNPSRVFNISAFAGGGINWAGGNQEINDIAATLENLNDYNLEYLWQGKKVRPYGRAGIDLEFKVSKAVSIMLEGNANMISDKYNSKKADNPDWYFNALAGVRINLGKSYTKKAKPVEEPAPAPAPKQEYVAPKPEPKPAPVEKKVEEIRRDIFFTINSYKIAPAEDAKIREVVDYLGKNPEAKVVVTGYADKGTGNERINDRIAAKRAAAVVWMLEKRYGISAERITEESKGARVQPFAENNMNRVSIMIAK